MPTLESLIDGHAHSQFSWDASEGSMSESCRQAARVGLGGIAFTEHADLTDWTLPPSVSIDPDWKPYLHGRTVKLPRLDVQGYLAEVEECRAHFPELRILSGVEISEPHWHQAEVRALLAEGRFDRVLSSVHAGLLGENACEVYALFREQPAEQVLRDYLAEATRMIQTVDVQVLAHIDYAARYWPRDAGPHDVEQFEDDYRQVLEALAMREGALEINTQIPLDPRILTWWIDAGGRAITFGSDSHAPDTVGAGLPSAVELASSLGFLPSSDPATPWRPAHR
jgi:histidinol-phosphatase (PHP family)